MSGIDSFTKLLLHCDGADASTTFTDSATGKTVTATGNAQVDTAQSKFGGASLLCDGAGDYLTSASHADWNLGAANSGNLTIDWWVRFASLSGIQALIAADNAAYSTGWELYWVGASNELFLYFGGAESGLTWLAAINTWYHLALVRSGSTVTCYIGGTSIGTFTDGDFNNDSNALLIGADGGGATDYFNGWTDEIRVSKGIARWTANFTTPAAAYSFDGARSKRFAGVPYAAIAGSRGVW